MPEMTLQQALAEGERLERTGQQDDAAGVYRAIVEQVPGCADAVCRLAFLVHRSGQADEALKLFQRAAQLRPNSAECLGNLGIALAGQRRFKEAGDVLARAIELAPGNADLHNNLGNVLNECGLWEQATHAYQKAITLNPQQPVAYFNLGNALYELSRPRDAISAQQRAIALKGDFAEAYVSLGNALCDDGRVDDALAAYTRAIELRPELGAAWDGLGVVYRVMGQAPEALAAHRRGLELSGSQGRSDAILSAMHLDPAMDSRALLDAHVEWNEKYAAHLAHVGSGHTNDPNPEKRIRVGYVSAYLSGRPAGRFMLPLLANHDHKSFEVFCYSDTRAPDAMTQQLRAGADVWRETARLSDDALAEQVHQDQIDILIDLGMHTRNNRMLAFARKPAPVQATYLAYCSTTGLRTIDYRISDSYLDPPGSDESLYSERTVRLASYWCYPPPVNAPEVVQLPAFRNGYVTFGCLNDFSKVSAVTLSMWADILRQMPTSRLVLHCIEGTHRNRVLAALGVEAGRVEFVGMVPGSQYFAQYGQIDVALDPTPWCGGTTTCDALWMGVPVVTLRGRTAVSRGGVSILGQLDLREWVANQPDEYVQIARALTVDLHRLSEIRNGLRDRMLSSRLMDQNAFAGEFETVLREMWRKWCAGR
ncbi:MAG TPA: tetratricopeptide repeat protein [Tepidisphaeraceae bacterium]|jgi:predicted O-linked N-acetylglucosamine transferase (SPINDLY family)